MESHLTLPCHYSDGRMRNIGYELVEDSAQHEPELDVLQPTLFDGLNDDVVPASYSAEFAAAHPVNVKLQIVDSGHELTNVLDEIWRETAPFLIHSEAAGL